MTGFAWIAGAGPGDPGLITVSALQRLREAEVVLHDRLLNRRLLDEAKAGAELIDVGKTGDSPGMRQADVNRLLVELVGQGRRVIRLKGGDPYVFGRGGEEAEALADAGLPFAVIPGISSALAAPAYAGIPVTHRGLAGSFAVLTGHEESGEIGGRVDIGAIAAAVDTVVVLMGVGGLSSIVGAMLAAGRGPETPAALVERGTYPAQRTVVGTLATIVDAAAAAGVGAPAAFVAGPTVALRPALGWFERQPLAGKRVLITRPAHQAGETARRFEELGAEAVILPAVAIVPASDDDIMPTVRSLTAGTYDWLVLTSANGVRVLFDTLGRAGLDTRALGGTRVAAIGPGTAESLAARGLNADLVPDEFISESLGAALVRDARPGARVLLARAAAARPVLGESLRLAGLLVEELTLYHSIVPPVAPATLSRVTDGEIDAVTLASPSAAEGLHAMLGGDLRPLDRAAIASIGPVTTAAARGLGFQVRLEAPEHTIEALVEAVRQHFASQG